MLSYNSVLKVFRTAAELRDDFTQLLNERGQMDKVTKIAFSRYSGALDIIKAIGGTELEDEFSEWYLEEYIK